LGRQIPNGRGKPLHRYVLLVNGIQVLDLSLF
jgi:hypothetical protein